MLNIKRIDHVLNTTVYSMTNTVPLIHLVRHCQLKFLGHILRCQRKSLLEDMLCTFQPLAKGDLVDHVLHTLIMYKDCLGIMKEQCKNSRLPHLLMIVVHGETLWSPAPQPMDDDDVVDAELSILEHNKKSPSAKKKNNSFFSILGWGVMVYNAQVQKHRKKVVFQGEACTVRVMFRVSKTAKIKKKGDFLKANKKIWD